MGAYRLECGIPAFFHVSTLASLGHEGVSLRITLCTVQVAINAGGMRHSRADRLPRVFRAPSDYSLISGAVARS